MFVSVITPTYNTNPAFLHRAWQSLKNQTYSDWEWVVWDDSTQLETWSLLSGFASDERYDLKMHRSLLHSGIIGEVKRRAFMVSEGDILLEFDHDDELTPECLSEVVHAFQDPEVGFVYSDWCEILPEGVSGKYPDGWAFGYGSHYWSEEHQVWVMRSAELNRTTMSHIVSVPNHVRAWRASVYRELNGHNSRLPVADDYDLIVRTVLTTKCHHIPKLLYKQYISQQTTQRTRNELIQDLVSELSAKYSNDLDRHFAREQSSESLENPPRTNRGTKGSAPASRAAAPPPDKKLTPA